MGAQTMDLDVLINGATVVDGTGAPAVQANIGIVGERIVGIGDFGAQAARVIDASGLVACPGFVDAHSHADLSILQYPLAENLIMQGITTFVGGNCGFSPAPVKETGYAERLLRRWSDDGQISWRTFGDWLDMVETHGISPNYVPLVGHNSLRGALMGQDFQRAASRGEVAEMELMLAEALQSGAHGVSVGLDAAWPGHFAERGELAALVRATGERGGLFAPHTRHHQNQWPVDDPAEFGYGLFHAPRGEIITGRYHGLLEAVEIARAAGSVKTHIAHFTPAYIVPQPHPAFLDDALAQATLVDVIDRANDEGLDVSFNAIAWSQSIGAEAPILDDFFSHQLLLPDWLRALDREAFVERLSDPPFRARVKNVITSGKFKFGMIHPLTDPYWIDCYRILRCRERTFEGRTLGELARERQPGDIIRAVYETSLDVLLDILAVDPGATWALIIDKREYGALAVFFQHPRGVPCTDVAAMPAQPVRKFNVPPSAYGLYPHYLRTFVKEKGALSLEHAVRKATSVPAREVFGLQDRGVLREGAYADVVLFDFDALEEANDFLKPAQPPRGISQVFVNGVTAYERGRHTGALPGKVLRRGEC